MPIKRDKNLTLLNLPGTYVLNDEDFRLFKREWLCPNMSEAKAIVFILPDIGEHSDYYDDFAKKLNNNNLHVCMVDYIGHGKSEGSRFVVKDFENVIRDIDTNVLTIRARFNNIPIILFGYSFGAILATVVLTRNDIAFGGVILENPFYEFSKLKKDFINSCFCGKAGNYAVDLDKLTNNKEFIEFIRSEKNSYNGRLKAVTVNAAQEFMELFFESLSEVRKPLLILHGEKNEMSNVSVSQNIHDKCSTVVKNLSIIKNGKHMIHNEVDETGEALISAISVWIRGLTAEVAAEVPKAE